LKILFFNEEACFASNRKSKAMNIPGITISPNPSIENDNSGANKSFGNKSFTGASNDFATVTITSVPNTQKIS